MSVEAFIIKGNTGPWEMVIGLEVHAQILSEAKLFSGASATFGAEPNTQVSLVDAAMPGMLPVINRFCVEQAVRTGLGLQATINLVSVFDRKNYFYADLPQGYQISQYTRPLVSGGHIDIDLSDGSVRRISITRLHVEQDAGKSFHDQHPNKTYVDLNRAGVALMEIVSEPDLRSPEEACLYLRKLRTLLRYLGTCDGNMEEGSLRCDANVSVRRPGEPYGTRCEIKNLNSIRFVSQAILYDAERQVALIEDGGTVKQETRLFDSGRGVTRAMRSKEMAHDYRYFPDPDLLPLTLDPTFVEGLNNGLPELPDQRRRRYIEVMGLGAYDASLLVAEKETAAYYEALAKGRDAKLAANWVTGALFATLNRLNCPISESPVTAVALGELLDFVTDGTLSNKLAKDVFEVMVEEGKAAAAIVEERGLRQVIDTVEIDAAIEAVLSANSDKLAEFRAGKDKLFGFFVGQVMKATGGKINPVMLNERLRFMLNN